MPSKIHPVEPEELMAYLDGELTAVRATAVAEHLERCRECQILRAEFQSMSQSLATWEVEEKDPVLSSEITQALDQRERRLQGGGLWKWLRGGGARTLKPWMGGALVGGLGAILLASSMVFTLGRGEHGNARLADRAEPVAPPAAATTPQGMVGGVPGGVPEGRNRHRLVTNELAYSLTESRRAELAKRRQESDLVANLEVTPSAGPETTVDHAVPTPAPMILRTAQLTMVTPNLDKARADMDKILQRYGGYIGELTTSSPAEAARKLTATLRVPGNQLDAALADLKKLGRVESESQSGQDVTAQYVDLEARLSNSRKGEQRLLELLQQRTGKLSDVLEVETELSRVREQIERMEGERRLLSKQVQFATVNATVTEEFKAPARALPQSLGTQFHNAAVDGYQTVVDFVIGVALFLISDGPMLLLWAAVLFFPARYAWRKLRGRGLPEDVR